MCGDDFLEVFIEAVGVGHGHLVDGLFPTGNSGSFHESSGCHRDSFALLRPLCSSFIFNVADHQPQRLQRRLIVSKLDAVAGSFTQLIVKRLNQIRGVDDLSRCWWELQKRDEPPPTHPARPSRTWGISHPAQRLQIRLRPP